LKGEEHRIERTGSTSRAAVIEVKISVEFVWYCRIFYVPLVPGYFARFLQVNLCRRPELVLVKSAASFVMLIIRTFSYKKMVRTFSFPSPFSSRQRISTCTRLLFGRIFAASRFGVRLVCCPLINTNDTQLTAPCY